MGQPVDDLEELGYLRRGPDPADRRAKFIVFTDRGDKASTAGYAAIDEVERRLAVLLGKDGLTNLRATLSRVIAGFWPGGTVGQGPRVHPLNEQDQRW